MSSLTGTKISDTYVGLLKTLDTTPLSATPKEISDGLGNASGVKLDNDGNLDVTNTVAFGSLKDTAEDITITKFVDEADGIENNDDDTSLPTSAAVKDYVDAYVTAQDFDFSGNTGTGRRFRQRNICYYWIKWNFNYRRRRYVNYRRKCFRNWYSY